MRGMNEPTSAVPWYRAVFARTDRGRRLRRRLVPALVVVTAAFLVNAINPRGVARWAGIRIKSECHRSRECDMPCEVAHAYCMNLGHANDPTLGTCVCPTREQAEAHFARLTSCPPGKVAHVTGDNGEAVEWVCVTPEGGVNDHGGEKGGPGP